MKVGDKVVCLNGDWADCGGWGGNFSGPKVDEIYLVTGKESVYGKCWLHLKGWNPKEAAFRSYHFRKVEPKSEKNINKELAGIGIERIKRECEPSKITAPEKQEA